MPSERTRAALRITAMLAVLGAMAGALASVPMTILGKVLSGGAPADIATYLWNLRSFAIMGAVAGPVLGWGALRRVPLWRAAVEPLLVGMSGAVLGFLLAADPGFLLGSAAGVALATLRLNLASRRVSAPPGDALRPPPGDR